MIIETSVLFGDLTADVIDNAIVLKQEDDTVVLTIRDIQSLYDLSIIDTEQYIRANSRLFKINDEVVARLHRGENGFNLETEWVCLSINNRSEFLEKIFKLFQEECVPELEWKVPGCDAVMHSSETFEGDEEGDYNTEFSVHQHQGRDMLSIIQTHDGEAEVVFTKDELKVLVKYLNTIIPTMNA
ncbi:thymidine kinase [Escherichia phage vB_EcoM_ESCO47]|nr:thymidine kinase [Escherichia phage vB_EcoM_ESCO47]